MTEDEQIAELRRRLAVALEEALRRDEKIPYTEQGIRLLEAIMRREIVAFECEHGLDMLDTGVTVAEYQNDVGIVLDLQLSPADAPPLGTPEWFTLHCERLRFVWDRPTPAEVAGRVIRFRPVPAGRIEWRPPSDYKLSRIPEKSGSA